MVHKERMKTKSDPPPAAADDEKKTPKLIQLRPEDRERLDLARKRTGIGNDTDVIRHALAKLCEPWEATAKVSDR